ncbi:MAG: hypothetical protein WBB33_04740 [Candidatus Saccharimonadales bacterium]
MTETRTQIRIDASKSLINRAKAIAYGRGQSLTEFVLLALANTGDKELTKLVEKDLEKRPTRGRPEK